MSDLYPIFAKTPILIVCLAVAYGTGARAQQTSEGGTSLGVGDNIPAGFENLMQERSFFVEVTFNDKLAGTFEIIADAENLTFNDPVGLLDALKNIQNRPALLNILASQLPTNAHLVCFARNEPDGCGQIEPSPLAVIFDESLLKLELFVAAEYQLIQNQDLERYLPPADSQGSSILAFDFLGSSNPQQASLDFTTRAIASYGAGQIFTEAEYNTRTDTTRVRSIQLTHLFRDQELRAGTFRYGDSSLLNNTQIAGASFASSQLTRVDLDEAFSSQLILYLPRRSLVQIIVDERVYLAQNYPAGNQTIDTGALPGGTYTVDIRISDPITGVRIESQLFTKSARIPPRGETVYDITLGVPLTFSDDTLPVRQDLRLGGASVARRFNDQSSWRLGVVNVGTLSMAEASYLLLSEKVSLQLSLGAGTENIRSGTFRLNYINKRSTANLNATLFGADEEVYDDDALANIISRDATQITASLSHLYKGTSFSARVRQRTANDNSGESQTTLERTLSLRRQLYNRGKLRLNLQTSYRSATEGYRFSVNLSGSIQQPNTTTSLSLQRIHEQSKESQSKLQLSHRIRSGIEARTNWNAGLRAAVDDTGETLGIQANIDNSLVSASVSNEWTRTENDEIFASTTTARLGTRVAIDGKGLALGGGKDAKSGVILDVSGEPQGTEYDIVVNGTKHGVGRIGQERFIGLQPLKKYSVQLFSKADQTSELDDTEFEFTVYPGSVKRVEATARNSVLLIASIVDQNGISIDDGYIEANRNVLHMDKNGLLQIDANPGAQLIIQRHSGRACSIVVPVATEDNGVSVPLQPLVCVLLDD